MPVTRGKASPPKAPQKSSTPVAQSPRRNQNDDFQSPSSTYTRKRGRTASTASDVSTGTIKAIPKRMRQVKEEVEDDFIDVDSDMPSSSSANEVSTMYESKTTNITEPTRGPSSRRGRPCKQVKEETTNDEEAGLGMTASNIGSPSSRHSRVRQPSRKILEMQQAETLVKQVTPVRKKRTSETIHRTPAKVVEENLENNVAVSVDIEESIQGSPIEVSSQVDDQSMDTNLERTETEQDHLDHLAEPTGYMRSSVIPPSTTKTALSEIQFDHVDDFDLPEEHKPKNKARPVIMSSNMMKKRPYFVPQTSNRSANIPPSAHSNERDHEMDDMIIQEPDLHSSSMAGDIMEKVRNGEYTIIDENGQQIDENVTQIVYEMGEGDYVEEVDLSEIAEDLEILEEREIQNPDGTTSIIQSVAPREPPKIENQAELTVKTETVNEEEDDDAPPRLVPELGPTGAERPPRRIDDLYLDSDNVIRVHSPGGTAQFVHVERGEDGTEIYIDANGDEVQMIEEQPVEDLRTVEFNFLDSKNVCCGLCGEIVAFDTLMSHHLPQMHQEILTAEGDVGLEEIPYHTWLKDKLYTDRKNLEGGFRQFDSAITSDDLIRSRVHRPLRKVSQIRVNPIEMSLNQLDAALKKKMIEKMGRKVPVSLVDKQHARCGICNAVVSLNKKFEIVHLVRHFNAWHPSAHRCAGTWQKRPAQPGVGKPLSIQDFAVIDVALTAPDNLQCIWCGMFMDRDALAMHFTEVHPDEIEVPKCLLCLQELVINARLLEKYGEDFDVVLPDEFHVKCGKFDQSFSSESALDRAIGRRVQKMQNSVTNDVDEEDDEAVDPAGAKDASFTNSRMQFGRRNKPKRSFVQPCFRQAVPVNSLYVQAVSECQWKCKLCDGNIFGAVISAGAIKHYKQHHPGEMENMQYELCKARLERISDGCMEFVHPQLVECLLCNLTYALHKPYNMCRGIRHLKTKHPEMMPEFAATPLDAVGPSGSRTKGSNDHARRRAGIQMGETIEDPEMLARFKNEYNVDFDKVQTVYGADGEPVYVLLGEGEELDAETAMQVACSLDEGDEVVPDETFDDDDVDEYEIETERPTTSNNRQQPVKSEMHINEDQQKNVEHIEVINEGEIEGEEIIEYLEEDDQNYEEVYEDGEHIAEIYVTDDDLPPEEYLEQEEEYLDENSHFSQR